MIRRCQEFRIGSTLSLATLLLTVLPLAGGGCASEHDATVPFASVARDRQQLFEHLDSEVAIVGKAEARKERGVTVLLDDGTRVGVPELDPWPKKVLGKTVTVTGKLRRLATPDPQTTDAQSVEIFLLEGARWRAGDKPPREVRTR
jgi:hypothetical protein